MGTQDQYEYRDGFYNYINRGAIQSARVVLPILLQRFNIRSVVDFGCGQGAWLSAWKTLGVTDIFGIDGDYVSRASLLIDRNRFQVGDVRQAIRLNRKFDLVQSLEVAEHLPESAGETFIDSLVAHGDIVLFSAAVPGQGGENHINERPYEYWRDLFRQRKYVLLDLIRSNVMGDEDVDWWYRYNSFVYVKTNVFEKLPPEVTSYRIDDFAVIRDISPLTYRIRKLLLRGVPNRIITRLAVLKKCNSR